MIARIGLLLIISLLIFGCGNSVEGQRKRWAYNMDRVDFLAQKYPNFNVVLADIKKKSESQFSSALQEPEEETKIQLMSYANKAISPSFVRKLYQLDNQYNELRQLQEKLAATKQKGDEQIVSAIQANTIEQLIKNTQAGIQELKPSSVAQADRVVNQLVHPIEQKIKSLKTYLTKSQQDLETPRTTTSQ